jgi:hypothetical protein
MATYGLDIASTDVPDLPPEVEHDSIAYKDDFMESADVFGFVPIKLTSSDKMEYSSRVIANWFAEKMRCDQLAIGEIRYDQDVVIVNIHSSKVSLALKAVERYDLNGIKLSAEV